jgi:signal-transduction protein with cAMP-binding, CBS, and nucleotidyltransferase domain
MDDKKEMISELTHTAWSLIKEYENELDNPLDSTFTLEKAQQLAKDRVAQIRYGSQQKDYFWIIDKEPIMVMHPYRPDLTGRNLNDYYDANGKALFVEATKVVAENNEGFVDYMWQWKDDSTKIVPKLSCVKYFEPWDWIVGTGVYLDDVEEEIRALKNTLLIISLIIAFIIAMILLFVVRQSLGIEKRRQVLHKELHKSRQKYKSLVEASNEGMIMFLDEKIIFSNSKFRNLCGLDHNNITSKKLEDFFDTNWDTIQSYLKDDTRSYAFETSLVCADNIQKEVVLSVSKVKYANTYGYIVSTKEVSKKAAIARESDRFSSELRSSLSLMKQSIKPIVESNISCTINTTIQEAIKKMDRLNKECILIKQDDMILGVASKNEIAAKVIANNTSTEQAIASVMSSPLLTISESAGLHEALFMFKKEGRNHLVTLDQDQHISGYISYKAIVSLQHNSLSYLLYKIEKTNTVEELRDLHDMLPAITSAIIESNQKAYDTATFISSISDKITQKIIALAIDTFGPAPCKFAFIAVGSEGRQEQSLLTDQDNGIIYQDGFEDASVKDYFQDLSNFIADALNDIGYNYCKGGMMACNPKWCQPVSVWKSYFSKWFTESDIEALVEASTFLDFRTVDGEEALLDELKEHVYSSIESNKEFLVNLADMTANFKSPINAFGSLVSNDLSSEGKTIDLKAISAPIVKYARVQALNYGIDKSNTTERLIALYEADKIPSNLFKDIDLAYNYLMNLRLKNQSKLIQAGEKPSNSIEIIELSSIEKGFLKQVFGLINTIVSNASDTL